MSTNPDIELVVRLKMSVAKLGHLLGAIEEGGNSPAASSSSNPVPVPHRREVCQYAEMTITSIGGLLRSTFNVTGG
ncbi:MAG TPA: hypothetical protein VNS61_01660 [Caldimonas sp.]|nr:hypothetical protein [Caldimonas sp.]